MFGCFPTIKRRQYNIRVYYYGLNYGAEEIILRVFPRRPARFDDGVDYSVSSLVRGLREFIRRRVNHDIMRILKYAAARLHLYTRKHMRNAEILPYKLGAHYLNRETTLSTAQTFRLKCDTYFEFAVYTKYLTVSAIFDCVLAFITLFGCIYL